MMRYLTLFLLVFVLGCPAPAPSRDSSAVLSAEAVQQSVEHHADYLHGGVPAVHHVAPVVPVVPDDDAAVGASCPDGSCDTDYADADTPRRRGLFRRRR